MENKSFLIDTIMHEKKKLIHRQKTPIASPKSRESSPVSESFPNYRRSPISIVYTHSPESSPRSPASPKSSSERHNHHDRKHHVPTSICSVRGSSSCTCCQPHGLQPVCTLCEPGPREGEGAPTQMVYQLSRDPQACTRYYYSSERPRVYPIGSPIHGQRVQFSPNYGK